jgi:hypothetical protein
MFDGAELRGVGGIEVRLRGPPERAKISTVQNHRYTGAHLRPDGRPCLDGYGDLRGPDDAEPPKELPKGAPGMLCHVCGRALNGVALTLASSLPVAGEF